ncbi:MAG: hypothetical protein KBT11_09555 [Treponema sp.]|nr:hypothetical protein [Candidatus Treponema equifaecale]
MADMNDKSVAGRKVFFVCPSFSIESTVISRLRTMEYECYVVDDYRKAKNLMLVYKESIFYISPDSQLTRDGWKNFIKSVTDDSVFDGTDIGVISENLAPAKQEDFAKDLKLNAGFFAMLGTEKTLQEVVKSLDKLGAKGLRKYVRVSCMDDEKAELYFFTKDMKMFRFKLIDISAVGVATKLPASQGNAVFVNQLISDANLVLKRGQVPVVAKVTAIKAAPEFLLVVMMFTIDTDKSSLDQIHSYVTDTLQNNMEFAIKGFNPDKTNYDAPPKKAKDENEA